MATKKATERLRSGPVTPEEIDKLHRDVTDVGAQLNALADELDAGEAYEAGNVIEVTSKRVRLIAAQLAMPTFGRLRADAD